jgi:formylglycine-generating enzyme required for sulfatase activity
MLVFIEGLGECLQFFMMYCTYQPSRSLLLQAILLWTLSLALSVATSEESLPNESQFHQLLSQAKIAMQNRLWKEAIVAFEKIEYLSVNTPIDFNFFYGKALLNNKQYPLAQKKLYTFLISSGSEHPNYKEAFDLARLAVKYENTLLEWTKVHGTTLDGIDCVLIKPGSFMMGNPASEITQRADEAQHKVTISLPFLMAITEVTQSQYETLMGSNPSEYKDAFRPVEQVTWDEAMAFCFKLNSRLTLPEGYQITLPTEAQWEYASRADAKDNHVGEIDRMAWEGLTRKRTLPVAQKRPNDWGLYDMHGNVWEWCADWYGDYPIMDVRDPVGPPTGSERVCRGGNYLGTAQYWRLAIRLRINPSKRYDNLGFRFVLSPIPE